MVSNGNSKKGKSKPLGEDSPHAKLTNDMALEIKKNYTKGKVNYELYEKYKNIISIRTFQQIALNYSWKHVKITKEAF